MPVKTNKDKNSFLPLRVDIESLDENTENSIIESLISENRLALHKKVVEGIEYSIKNRLPKVIHAEGYYKDTRVLIVSINSDDFEFHLEKSLRILESFEEYEYCSKILELKESLTGFKPKKPRKKRKPDTLGDAIKSI